MDQWVEFVEDLDNSWIFQFGVFEWLKNWDGVWVDDNFLELLVEIWSSAKFIA